MTQSCCWIIWGNELSSRELDVLQRSEGKRLLHNCFWVVTRLKIIFSTTSNVPVQQVSLGTKAPKSINSPYFALFLQVQACAISSRRHSGIDKNLDWSLLCFSKPRLSLCPLQSLRSSQKLITHWLTKQFSLTTNRTRENVFAFSESQSQIGS